MTRAPCYATLYEEWLVKYQQLTNMQNNGIGKENDKVSIDEAMTIRAARLVPLLADASVSPLFVHQITWDMDRDASSQLLQSMDDFQNMSIGIRDEGLDDDDEHDVDEMSNADAFFNRYPECVREDGNASDEEEEEELSVEAFPALIPRIQQNDAQQLHHRTQTPSEPLPPGTPRNPYAAPRQQQMLDRPSSRGGITSLYSQHQPQQHRNHRFDAPQNRSTNDSVTWETVQQHGNNRHDTTRIAPSGQSSWDAIPSAHNAFQSAAQFRYLGDDGSEKDDHENRNYQHGTGSNKSCSRRASEPDQPPPMQRISQTHSNANFNLPKRIRSTAQNEVQEEGKLTPSRSGDKDSGNDEDDLPEALRGLDKELIEKIENEILDSGETVTFDDIAGLEHAKATVQELVCWPMKRPDLFTGLRRGPNGLLLYGPPGTGKTLIGKAVAHESGATFFSISSSSLTSKWIGEGEKLVRTLFAVAAYREPAVVFIDEIDSLLTQRKSDENEASRRIKTEFLVQLDGTGGSKGRVLVVGATNRPHELDDAARRRFVKRLYIPLPAAPDRESLIRTLLGKNQHSLTDACISKLALATDGFSGADLKALCVEAAMGPLRGLGARALQVEAKDVPHIAYKHFRQALRG
ncbi:AAA ATPase-like protein [Fragilaria crotonensis]|nr:AAA ATPase-like protein [Fragilaria crotonensis]